MVIEPFARCTQQSVTYRYRDFINFLVVSEPVSEKITKKVSEPVLEKVLEPELEKICTKADLFRQNFGI